MAKNKGRESSSQQQPSPPPQHKTRSEEIILVDDEEGDKKNASESLDSSDEENVYTVERISGKKVKRGKVYYYIKWEGYPESQNTWELVDDVFCKELIDEFENQLLAKSSQSQHESPPRSPSHEISKQQITPEIPDVTTNITTTTTATTVITASHESSSPLPTQKTSNNNNNNVVKRQRNEGAKKTTKAGKKKKSKTDKICIEDRPTECGFEYGDEVEHILGAQEIDDSTSSSSHSKQLMFYVKWKGKNAASFILSHEAHARIPQQVIQFYESRLRFQDPPHLSD